MMRPRLRLFNLGFSDIWRLVLFMVMVAAPLVLLVSCDLTPSPTAPRGLPTATALGRVVVEQDGTPLPGPTRDRSGDIPTITPTHSPTPTITPGTPLPTKTATPTFTPFVTPTRFVTATVVHGPPTVTPPVPPTETVTATVAPPPPPPEETDTPEPTEEPPPPRPHWTPTEEAGQ